MLKQKYFECENIPETGICFVRKSGEHYTLINKLKKEIIQWDFILCTRKDEDKQRRNKLYVVRSIPIGIIVGVGLSPHPTTR